MQNTQIKQFLGERVNAYGYVAMLSVGSQQKITELLEKLKNEIGDGLWVMPANALHITLCEIIQTKQYGEDSQLLFSRHANEYENVPSKIISGVEPITVTFDEIFVSQMAIIVKGKDDGSFNNIRKQLVGSIPLPDGTPPPPTIIHSSIARFTKELPLSMVEDIASRHAIHFQETVAEFQLLQNVVTPLLQYNTVRKYPLIKQTVPKTPATVRVQ